MGTLKDERREERLLGEKAEDGEGPGSSDGTAVTEASLKNTVVESVGQEPQTDYNKYSVCAKADATVDMETQSVSAAVPPTPDPTDPRSPAPPGLQHMRTQVSLEVVQCHSIATSPMTPPEGGHDNSFFFPSSFGKVEAVGTDTKDAELQVGQQVEYSSVATSPMTPKTPFFSTFSVLPNQKKSEEKEASKGPPRNAPENKQQQRMGSMDQDITILVTQHGNTEEEEEDKDNTQSEAQCPAETETAKEEEDEKMDQEKSKSVDEAEAAKSELKSANSLEAQENKDMVPESPAPFGCSNMRTQVSLEVVQCQSAATSPMTPPEGDQAFRFPTVSSKSGGVGTETKDAEMQVGQQVEYRSVATAPMTPRTPTATTFPDVMRGRSIEEKIVEEEEEEEKETPKDKCGEDRDKEDRGKRGGDGDGGEGGGGEGGKEGGVGEGAGDGETGDESKEGDGGDGGGGGGGGGESERRNGEDEQTEEEQTEEEEEEEEGEEEEEESNQDENCNEDKGEEPVQEVSWDEKGMTWEVYGAVVEVSVLGSAIQKHLEKQVKKQKKQTLPPPPPLNPSATPLGPTEAPLRSTGSGRSRGSNRGEKTRRNRRNPFRLMMENMQQPHCCSRAHTTE